MLAINESCASPCTADVFAKPIKSTGTTEVPWCSICINACCELVPTLPHTTGDVCVATAALSLPTCLPLLSMISCCKYGANNRSALEYGTTACVSRPKIDRFHTLMRPIITGMFLANGVSTKCSSTARIPLKKSSNTSEPNATTLAKLTADETEYLPPTHGQMLNECANAMPADVARCGSTETTAQCCATPASPTDSASHC